MSATEKLNEAVYAAIDAVNYGETNERECEAFLRSLNNSGFEVVPMISAKIAAALSEGAWS